MSTKRKASPASISGCVANVRAYVDMMLSDYEQDRVVIVIPVGSAAYSMGYRFTTCLRSEVDEYIAGGAKISPYTAKDLTP